jgi:hypothetical protein
VCRVVSAMDNHGRIFVFLDRSIQTWCSEIFEIKFVHGRHFLAATTEKAMPEAVDT